MVFTQIWYLHKQELQDQPEQRYHQLCRIYPPMTKLPDLTVTNFKKVQISKSEPKKFSRFCTFKLFTHE
jgi:hypothetical protein